MGFSSTATATASAQAAGTPSLLGTMKPGLVGPGLMAAGAASSIIGSYYSARASKVALQSQADLADINARISESGAQAALLQGQQQVAQLTLRAGQLKSSQRASMAANGIDLGVGSAAEVQASTEIMKEIDKNTLEANAVRAAWGYRTQEVNYQNEARGKRIASDTISPAGAAFSTLLTEGGRTAGAWYSLNRKTT